MDPQPWPEGSYELGFVHPSVFLSGNFLETGSLVFWGTQHGVRGQSSVVRDSQILFQKSFCPKNGKNGQKIGFLKNLLENLVVNFFRIWRIAIVYIIYFILAQIPYLGEMWFLRYWQKCSQPIRLQDFQINYICL